MSNEVSVLIQPVGVEGQRLGDKHDVFDTGFVKLRPRTHDISFTDNHIPDIQKLGADLNAAVQAVWPTRHESRYSQVNALLVSWADDDLGVLQEVQSLRDVFEDRYHFRVEEYAIPSIRQPDRALKRRVIDFLDQFDGQDALLIIYYAGHARRAPETNAAPLWCANRSSPELAIASGGIQSMFEEAEADVLLIYDCCHSAACPTTGSSQKGHVVEVIAACGYETVAPQVDKHSFSKTLTEILALKSTCGSFSIGELHARVLGKLKCWVPDLLTDENGKFVESEEGRLLYERQPRRTPIYSIVCEAEPRRSILLAPILRRDLSSSSSSGQDTPSSSPDAAPHDIHEKSNSCPPKKRKRAIEDEAQYPQILLAVRLERDMIDLTVWTEWIRNLPTDGRGIHIEGKYDSFSTLLLLRMPVSVWNLMPENSAYSFVGFVTSENLCSQTRLASNISCPCGDDCPHGTPCSVQSPKKTGDEFQAPRAFGIIDDEVSEEHNHPESPTLNTSAHKEYKGNDVDSSPRKPRSKAQGRKRTKKGCLTCRKRRINCGEERPTCQNCTKSKRQCEGYNQRVVFKDVLNAYRPSLLTSSHVSFPTGWSDGPRWRSRLPYPEQSHTPTGKVPAPVDFSQGCPANSTWDPSSASTTLRVFGKVDSVGNLEPETKSHGLNSRKRQGDQIELNAIQEPEDLSDTSDEDVEVWDDDAEDGHLRNNDLGVIVALQANQDSSSLPSFTSFIDRPDMLATYIPSSQSTPLHNPMAARIFCHFVNVTGPSISMFERHPVNPSLIFQGVPVPKSQQHIWTYTLPTLALRNSALLHAMLALASLHIAKLQNGTMVAAYKHYAISLRCIAKSVGLRSRPSHPATLAAALLLTLYEFWSANHQSWSKHLLGARQLVKEIDFVKMARYIKRKRAEKRRQQQQVGYHFEERRFEPFIDEVDENIVGTLMGRKILYDQYGRVIDENTFEWDQSKEYSEKDLEIYETQRDLFWWYCMQDTYQSIFSGGGLFLDYSLWSHCSPRAPLGRLNATYGTFDHLILLMGRLANFAAKDLKRKRLAVKINGSRSQPPESMRMQANQPLPTQDMLQTPAPLPMRNFSSIVADVKEASLLMGFEQSSNTSASTQSDDIDLQMQTQEAEEEWQDIRNAFTVLEDHFGVDFQALGPEFSSPTQTPFGSALQYRTYNIAAIWMNYYMGLIFCHRSHPSMPPEAMMAAGISAQQTAFFANELGRIAAGIAPDCSMAAQVNPGVAAALIQSCNCLFVSGVQYQNADQRAWTICRLRDIARLTGWQSAIAIAAACEIAWEKAAEQRKSPPYSRIKEEHGLPYILPSSGLIYTAFDGETTREGSDRAHYTMGALNLEEEVEKLDLDSNVLSL